MEKYWRGLFSVLKEQEVQLFTTTHSRECMEAAQKAASSEEESDLRYLRLDREIDSPEHIIGTDFDWTDETFSDLRNLLAEASSVNP